MQHLKRRLRRWIHLRLMSLLQRSLERQLMKARVNPKFSLKRLQLLESLRLLKRLQYHLQLMETTSSSA